MPFNPFALAPTHLGTCDADKMDLAPCKNTEVVEISVNQGMGKQVLGTLCRDHADIWYTTNIKIITINE